MIQDNKSHKKRVKKQEKYSKKKYVKSDIISQRRKAFKLDLMNNSDYNTWDELCISLIPSWCKESRGIIIGKKNNITHEWDIKTSLHPQTNIYVFEKIQEYYDSNELNKELVIELWGKQFFSNDSATILEKNKVFWLRDKMSINELAISLFKNLCVIFFYNVDNKGVLSDEVILRFIRLLNKLTCRIKENIN